MEIGIQDVGRWCFVKRWGWGVIVRVKPPRFWVLVASGFTVAHPGKWTLLKVALEDVTELGPTLEVPWLELAPPPGGDRRQSWDP